MNDVNPFLSDRDDNHTDTNKHALHELHTHLAVMTRVARTNHAVSIAMIRVGLHLRVHAVVK